MQVQLESLSNLERRLNIALPHSIIDSEISKRLQRLARTAKIQGFRPGKAPIKIIAQNYGASVREEVLGEQVQMSFAKAVSEQALRVAGYPRFEPVPNAAAEEAFSFSAVFEIYPEVVLGDLAGKAIEKPVTEVTDTEIDKTLDILRKQRIRYNYVERAVTAGDRVIVDFKGSIDGELFQGGSAENYSFVLGQGQMLPEFESGVHGLKEGETRELQVNFPEDYHGRDVAGKTAVFAITVKNVAEGVLPEINEELARQLGIVDGDVAKMREEIKKNIGREVKRRLQARLKESVMQVLYEATPLEVPKALITLEVGRLTEQARQDLSQRGIDAKNMPLPADLFEAQAQRRVALGLILSEVIKTQGLKADAARVRAIVEEMADSYEHPETVVKWYYETPQNLEGPQSMVLEEQVVEFVLTQTQVSEKAVTFDELMGNA